MNRYLTEPEQATLLRTLRKEGAICLLARRDDAVTRALIHSGLRINEFSLITVGDALAALRTRYLFIPREHRKGWAAGKGERKTRDHEVFMTAPLREAIEDLLKVRAEMTGAGRTTEEAPLVISRAGERLTVRSYQLRMKKWGAMADLPPRFSPHWLRHTRGQNIMRRSEAKDPRGVVQQALGHADIRSSGVYTVCPREEVEAALSATDGSGAQRVTTRALRREYEGRAAA